MDIPEGATDLALCTACWCMTWTMQDGTCGKCREPKPGQH